MFKKMLSVFLSSVIILSFVLRDYAHAVALNPKLVVDNVTAPEIYDATFKNYARLTSSADFGGDTLVINIQDLHMQPEVQKNISSIIDILVKDYGVANVYVEGGHGNISTEWLSKVQDADMKKGIADSLLSSAFITGAEYYSAVNDRTNFLIGLEDEDVHKQNIMRLGSILDKKSFYEKSVASLWNELEFFQMKYFSRGNRRLAKLINNHRAGKISSSKYYSLLLKYLKQNFQQSSGYYGTIMPLDMNDYPNMCLYLYVSKMGEKLNYKDVNKELLKVMDSIKENVSYAEYKTLIDKTDGFKDIDPLLDFIKKAGLSNVSASVAEFIEYNDKAKAINPVKLITEERLLIENIRIALSQNRNELEISFLSDMLLYFEDYLKASISADDIAYLQSSLGKFQSLWEKYSFYNKTMNDLKADISLMEEYYAVNDDRNEIFLKHVFKDYHPQNRNSDKNGNAVFNETVEKLADGKKNVIVCVTGGYHSKGMTDLLASDGISYAVLTPMVSGGVESAWQSYEEYARNQVVIFSQTLALGIWSQMLQVMLSKGELSAAEIDMAAKFFIFAGQVLETYSFSNDNITMLINSLNQMSGGHYKFEHNPATGMVTMSSNGKEINLFSVSESGEGKILIRNEYSQEGKDNKVILESKVLTAEQMSKFIKNLKTVFNASSLNYGLEGLVPNVYGFAVNAIDWAAKYNVFLNINEINGMSFTLAEAEKRGLTNFLADNPNIIKRSERLQDAEVKRTLVHANGKNKSGNERIMPLLFETLFKGFILNLDTGAIEAEKDKNVTFDKSGKKIEIVTLGEGNDVFEIRAENEYVKSLDYNGKPISFDAAIPEGYFTASRDVSSYNSLWRLEKSDKNSVTFVLDKGDGDWSNVFVRNTITRTSGGFKSEVQIVNPNEWYGKPYDKSYIANYLRKDHPNATILFFGDRTQEGGNDFPLAQALKEQEKEGYKSETIQVNGPNDVMNDINNAIKRQIEEEIKERFGTAQIENSVRAQVEKEVREKLVFVFDVDGTLTKTKERMTEGFAGEFSRFCKENTVYLATGANVKLLKDDQVPYDDVLDYLNIYGSMGNEYRKGKYTKAGREEAFSRVIKIDETDPAFEAELSRYVEEFKKVAKELGYTGDSKDQLDDYRNGRMSINWGLGGKITGKDREEFIEWLKKQEQKEISGYFSRLELIRRLSQDFRKFVLARGGSTSIDIVDKEKVPAENIAVKFADKRTETIKPGKTARFSFKFGDVIPEKEGSAGAGNFQEDYKNLLTMMGKGEVEQISIVGVNNFRPSNWAEVLSGHMATIKEGRLRYSELLRPGRTDEGVICVVVDPKLKKIAPLAWDFLFSFARENNLGIDIKPANPAKKALNIAASAAAQLTTGASISGSNNLGTNLSVPEILTGTGIINGNGAGFGFFSDMNILVYGDDGLTLGRIRNLGAGNVYNNENKKDGDAYIARLEVLNGQYGFTNKDVKELIEEYEAAPESKYDTSSYDARRQKIKDEIEGIAFIASALAPEAYNILQGSIMFIDAEQRQRAKNLAIEIVRSFEERKAGETIFKYSPDYNKIKEAALDGRKAAADLMVNTAASADKQSKGLGAAGVKLYSFTFLPDPKLLSDFALGIVALIKKIFGIKAAKSQLTPEAEDIALLGVSYPGSYGYFSMLSDGIAGFWNKITNKINVRKSSVSLYRFVFVSVISVFSLFNFYGYFHKKAFNDNEFYKPEKMGDPYLSTAGLGEIQKSAEIGTGLTRTGFFEFLYRGVTGFFKEIASRYELPEIITDERFSNIARERLIAEYSAKDGSLNADNITRGIILSDLAKQIIDLLINEPKTDQAKIIIDILNSHTKTLKETEQTKERIKILALLQTETLDELASRLQAMSPEEEHDLSSMITLSLLELGRGNLLKIHRNSQLYRNKLYSSLAKLSGGIFPESSGNRTQVLIKIPDSNIAALETAEILRNNIHLIGLKDVVIDRGGRFIRYEINKYSLTSDTVASVERILQEHTAYLEEILQYIAKSEELNKAVSRFGGEYYFKNRTYMLVSGSGSPLRAIIESNKELREKFPPESIYQSIYAFNERPSLEDLQKFIDELNKAAAEANRQLQTDVPSRPALLSFILPAIALAGLVYYWITGQPGEYGMLAAVPFFGLGSIGSAYIDEDTLREIKLDELEMAFKLFFGFQEVNRFTDEELELIYVAKDELNLSIINALKKQALGLEVKDIHMPYSDYGKLTISLEDMDSKKIVECLGILNEARKELRAVNYERVAIHEVAEKAALHIKETNGFGHTITFNSENGKYKLSFTPSGRLSDDTVKLNNAIIELGQFLGRIKVKPVSYETESTISEITTKKDGSFVFKEGFTLEELQTIFAKSKTFAPKGQSGFVTQEMFAALPFFAPFILAGLFIAYIVKRTTGKEVLISKKQPASEKVVIDIEDITFPLKKLMAKYERDHDSDTDTVERLESLSYDAVLGGFIYPEGQQKIVEDLVIEIAGLLEKNKPGSKHKFYSGKRYQDLIKSVDELKKQRAEDENADASLRRVIGFEKGEVDIPGFFRWASSAGNANVVREILFLDGIFGKSTAVSINKDGESGIKITVNNKAGTVIKIIPETGKSVRLYAEQGIAKRNIDSLNTRIKNGIINYSYGRQLIAELQDLDPIKLIQNKDRAQELINLQELVNSISMVERYYYKFADEEQGQPRSIDSSVIRIMSLISDFVATKDKEYRNEVHNNGNYMYLDIKSKALSGEELTAEELTILYGKPTKAAGGLQVTAGALSFFIALAGLVYYWITGQAANEILFAGAILGSMQIIGYGYGDALTLGRIRMGESNVFNKTNGDDYIKELEKRKSEYAHTNEDVKELIEEYEAAPASKYDTSSYDARRQQIRDEIEEIALVASDLATKAYNILSGQISFVDGKNQQDAKNLAIEIVKLFEERKAGETIFKYSPGYNKLKEAASAGRKATIKDLDIKPGQKFLMRADFNVPMADGQITDETRITATLDTIRYITERGGKVVLMSHLGRPDGKVNPKYTLKPVAERLSGLLGQDVKFLEDAIGKDNLKVINSMENGGIALLENVRFYAEEENTKDADIREEFAGKLVDMNVGRNFVFVMDAFGTAHRAHASTVSVAKFTKTAVTGSLMAKELEFLGSKLEKPESPSVAILGGSKVKDKIGVIKSLLDKVDTIIVGGAMAYSFLAAQGIKIGNSVADEENIQLAKELLAEAKARGKTIELPIDHTVVKAGTIDFKEQKMLVGNDKKNTSGNAIESGYMGVDIGQKTIERFYGIIAGAKTVLWNGPMGIFEISELSEGTDSIAYAMEQATKTGATTIVGGGDSVAALNALEDKLGRELEIDHKSTGGGASLEFLEQGTLPGVEALNDINFVAKKAVPLGQALLPSILPAIGIMPKERQQEVFEKLQTQQRKQGTKASLLIGDTSEEVAEEIAKENVKETELTKRVSQEINSSRLVFIGAPLSGKGTSAVMAAKALNIPHISTGDIFRKNSARAAELRNKEQKLTADEIKFLRRQNHIDKTISEGRLVDDKVVSEIVYDRLAEADCENGFILDGYPRTVVQAQEFDKFLKNQGKGVTVQAVFLDAERNILQERLQMRIDEARAQGKEPRSDDNPETFNKRLIEFSANTMDVVKYYENQRRSVRYDIGEISKESAAPSESIALSIIGRIQGLAEAGVTYEQFWDGVMDAGTHLGGDAWIDHHINKTLTGEHRLTILDLGSGHGLETGYLLSEGHEVISADYSQRMLDAMHKNVPGSNGIKFDIEKDDWSQFKENQFDAIVASFSLHYFDEKTTARIINEIKRVLKPGGKLYVRVNSVNDKVHGAGDGELVEENFYIDRTRNIPKRYFDADSVQRFFAPLGNLSFQEVQSVYNNQPKAAFEIVVVNDKDDISQKPISGAVRAFLDDLKNSISAALEKMEEEQKPAQKDVTGTSKLSGFMRFLAGFRSIFIGSSYHIDGIINEISSLKTEYKTQAEAVIIRAVDLLRRELKLKDNRYYELADWVNNLKSNTSTGEVKVSEEEYYGKINELNLALRLFNMKYYSQSGTIYIDPALRNKGKGILNIIEIDKEKIFADFIKAGRITEEYDKGFHTFGYIINTPLTFDEMNTIINRIRQAEENIGKKSHYAEIVAYHEKARELLEAARKYAGSAAGVNYDLSDSSLSLDFIFPYSYGIDITKKLIGSNKKVRGVVFTDANKISLQFNDNAVARDLQEVIDMFNQTQITDFAKVAWMDLSGNAPSETGRREMEAKLARGAQFINELQSLKEQYIKINKEIKSYMEAVHGVVYKFNEKVNLGNRFMRTVNDAFEQGYIFSDTDMQTVQALIIEISDLLAETADFLDKAGFVASKESEYREYYEYYSNYLNLLEYVDKLKTNRNNLYSELEAALKILNIKSFKVYGDIIAVTFADSDKNAQKIWEEIIAKEKIDIVNITPYIDQTIYAINIYDLTPDKMNAVIKSFVSAASDTSQEDTKPSPIHFSETNEWGDVVYMTGNIMRKSRDLFKNDPDRATEQTKIDAGYIQTIGNENDNIAIDFSFSKVTKPLIGLLFKVALKMNVLRKIKAQFDGYHMNKSTDEDRAVLHTALRNVYYDYNELETEGPAKGLPKIKAYKPVYDRGSDGTERNNVMPEIIEALNQMRIIDLRLQKTQLVKEALSKGMSLEDAKKSVLEVESNGRKIVVDVEPLLGADGSPIETIVSIGIGGSYLGPRLVAESMGGFAKSYGLNVRFIQSVEPSDAETQLKGLKPESTMFIIQSKSWTTAETVMNRDLVLPFMIKGLKDKIPQDVQSKLIIQAASDPSLSYDTLAVKYIISHNCMAVTSKKSMAMDFGIDENNILSFGDYIGGRFSVWGPVGLPAMMSFGFDGFFEMLQGAHDVDAYVENHLGTDPDKPDYFENNAVLKMALIDILNVNGLNFKVNYTLPYASFLDQLAAYLQQLRMESLGKHVMADGRKVSDAARKIPWYYRFLDRLFGHKGRYLSEPDTNTEPVSLGSQAPGHQHSYGLHTVTSVSQQAGQMDFIGVLGTMTKDATEETSKMHTYAFVQLLSQVLVASEGWTKEQLDEKIESTKANKRKEMEKLGKSEAEINEEMGRIESIRDMYDFEGDRPVTVKMLSRLSPRTVGQLLAFEEHRVAFKGYIWNINAYDQPGVQAAKIAADFLFKWALGLGQTVVDTTSSVAGWVAKIADKYSQSKQKDDSEDSGAAIMQQNYPKVFAWLASGNSVLVTALKLAVIEFIPSIFSSDFVKMHLRKSNQGRAAFLHDFTWTIPILISSFFIITATPLGIPAVLMYAGAGILGTFFTNIAVHVAVDFKYIRKISQNIENVIPSVANEEQIKNANHLEVFVINERPENAEKYGFKNTGFTADGHIIWMSKKTGKVVLFSENADFNTIAASYESIVPVVLNRKGENFEISPIAIDDDKVMIMEGKSIKYLDNGITTVKQSYYDEILELCGGDPILAGEMIRNAIEAEKFAFAQDFVMDLSAFTLTDSIDKVVAAANKAGNNQIAIAYSAFKQSNDDAITRETVRKMSENGTRIFAVVLNVGEQYQNKQELEQKLIKQGFAGYIVKNKDMVGENGIGDVVGFKDFYSTADGREVKEIKDFKNSEDLSREIEKAGADSVKIVRMTDYFKHIVGLRDITDKIDSVGVFGRFGKFTFYDGAEMTVDHAVNTALGYKMWAIPSGFKAGDFDEITEMLKLGATPENIAKLQSKLTVELDNSDFKVASLMGVLNRIEAKTKDKSQTQRLEIRFAFLKTIAQRAKVKADIYSKTQNGLKDKNLERDMIQNALSGRDVNRVFINDFVNEIFRKDMNTTDVEKLAEKKALELVGNKAEAATMYQLLLLYAAKELDMKIDDSQNQPINARLVSEFLKAA